jgi:hypothetical protein
LSGFYRNKAPQIRYNWKMGQTGEIALLRFVREIRLLHSPFSSFPDVSAYKKTPGPAHKRFGPDGNAVLQGMGMRVYTILLNSLRSRLMIRFSSREM